jgi:hypothetical protein
MNISRNISRREVIKGAAIGCGIVLIAGPATSMVQAQPAPDPLRKRLKLEEFAKHQDLVDSLKRGVQAMMSRKPSDPTSWFYQAAVHGAEKQAIDDATARDPGVANVDQKKFWNQCPHFAELRAPSADFLIWHRAYLYYFERILRKAANDERLCLPYWNYLDDGQRTFPTLYGDPEIKVPNGPPTNPLFDARRENAFNVGTGADESGPD